MGNHFHLVVRIHPGEGYSDVEVKRRYSIYYQDDDKREEPLPGQIAMFRHKWEQLSEFVKEIKQTFSRYYNKRHNRRGFFWSDRFKSVLVEGKKRDRRTVLFILSGECQKVWMGWKYSKDG